MKKTESVFLKLFSTLYLPLFFGLAIFFYFAYVINYLVNVDIDGRLSADSLTYLDQCRSMSDFSLIAAGQNFFGPCVLLDFFSFEYTAVFAFNVTLLIFSAALLAWSYRVSFRFLLFLLCLNPMLFLSLPSINKEIVGVFVTCMICCFIEKRNIFLLIAAIAAAFFARWQHVLVIVAVMLIWGGQWIAARFLKLRISNFAVCILVLAAISVIYPIYLEPFISETVDVSNIISGQSTNRSTQYSYFLTEYQAYGLYFLTFLPKLMINLFAAIVRVLQFDLDFDDVYYTFGVVGSSIVFGVYLYVLGKKEGRRMPLSDVNLYAFLYCSVFCLSNFVAHRYFFPLYPVLCLYLSMMPRSQIELLNNKGR